MEFGLMKAGAETWGAGGRFPQSLKWGTAHAFVPPIFWEVVLSDVREIMKRVKKGVFLVR